MQTIKQNMLDNIDAIAEMYKDNAVSYGLLVRLYKTVENAKFQWATIEFNCKETVSVAAVYAEDVAYVTADRSHVLLVSKFEDDMIPYAGYYDFIVTVFCDPPGINCYVMYSAPSSNLQRR